MAPPPPELPAITEFTVTPAWITQGEQVTVDWQTANATTCRIDPVPGGPVGTSGTMQLPVDETTFFALSAMSPGGTVSAVQHVVVMPVEITSFTATPSTVAWAGMVTLAWETQFATSCSLGVWSVPLSGSIVVEPLETTAYSLDAHGLDPQTRVVVVTVTES